MKLSDRLSKHYVLGELIRSETAERKGIDNMPPEAYIPRLVRLCEKILEPVYAHYRIPFSPNSGYRSPELNAAIGGSPHSQHCKAEAVDIEIPGISNYDLAVWVRDHLEYDQLILECYRPGELNSGWVHVSLKQEGEHNRKQVKTYANRQYYDGLLS